VGSSARPPTAWPSRDDPRSAAEPGSTAHRVLLRAEVSTRPRSRHLSTGRSRADHGRTGGEPDRLRVPLRFRSLPTRRRREGRRSMSTGVDLQEAALLPGLRGGPAEAMLWVGELEKTFPV